jgi:glycerophosphoryl diester phosphodiesterase
LPINKGAGVLPAGWKWISDRPIAHRGLHDSAGNPENSLGAFQAAVAAGYGIELDIHCTRDGRLVVFHDDDTKRLTDRDLRVRESSFAELADLRLAGTEYRINALDEVLAAVDGQVPVLVEVKTGTPMSRVGPLLATILAGYQGPVAVQSFDPRVVLWLRRHLPDVPRGQLCGAFTGEHVPIAQKLLLRSMLLNAASRPHFIAFEVDAMPDRFVSFWRRRLDVPLLLWTIRTQDQLATAGRYRANAIFEGIRPAVQV